MSDDLKTESRTTKLKSMHTCFFACLFKNSLYWLLFL